MNPIQLWAILGVVLLIAEVASTTFVFAFLGAGALATAATTWAGLTPGLPAQLLVFSAVSVGSLVLFRRKALDWFLHSRPQQEPYTEFTGERATVTQTIPAGGEGRITYRGTEWTARTATGQAVASGKHVLIQRMDGICAVVDVVPTNVVTP